MPKIPASSILYVGSRLPELSETFVYRELLGLRARGRTVIAASVRKPRVTVGDPALAALAGEAFVVYSAATMAFLPRAIALHPLLFARSLVDAATADHANLASRLKHVVQAMAGLALGRRLRRYGIGHVHAHMAHVPATIALYAARALNARFSFTGHAADLFVQRAGLRFKLRNAAFAASISRWHQHFYSSITALDLARIPLIRCSVAMPGDGRPPSREIVTVARLVSKKGIDLLLRAFAESDLSDWQLRIMGDGPERDALEQLTGMLGLEDRVTFEGARPHAACLEAIAGAGMFVLPCRTAGNGDRDGIPVVLMEAMSASRPVVCGDLPTIRELVEDGRSGLMVPPDDWVALASAMRRIAGDRVLAERLGAGARERIAEEFCDDINLDRLCAAFDQAAGAA